MKTHRSSSDAFVVGLALFAMFFGAGSLIFPPYLGMETGTSWFLSFMCFFVADVGLAFVTIVAMINGDGSISGVTGVIGRLPALIMNTAVIVCIGPLLAIPRTAATTFEMSVAPIMSGASRWLFSVIFFGLVIVLTIRPNKVVDIVGKFLTPAMAVALVILIGAGILHPLGSIGASVVDSPVREGILNGYQAMDVLGALGFAMIIIENVSGRGYTVGRERTKVTTRACVLAGGMLFAVYCGLTYLGATVSQKYDITTVNQAGLIVDITRDMLGTFGVVMLGVIVALACLTTAIGLTSASADYFEHITSGRVSYKAVVIIVSVFSMVVSNFGLSTIISIAVPILSLVYPVVVILIILSFFRRRLLNTNVHKCASLAALIVSALTVISGYGVSMPLLDKLPLASFGLNWIVPAAVFGLLGALIPMKKRGGGPEKAG